MKHILISKLLLIFGVVLAVGVWFVPVANAVDVFQPCEDISSSSACPTNPGSNANPLYGPDGVLTNVVSILSMVLGVIAVIVLIVAGIRMTLSQGDSQKIQSARNTIIYAVVGVVVALLAQAIVQLVLEKL